MTALASTETTSALGRDLALGLLGSAAFGGAAALGHGPWTVVRGAWMAPALFVGGALLAAPPLYMFGALAGSRQRALVVAARCARSLAAVATVLLGLTAPAAFLSVTMSTQTAPMLLLLSCATLGLAGVFAITRETLTIERKDKVRTATFLWTLFAVALGLRLLIELLKKGGF